MKVALAIAALTLALPAIAWEDERFGCFNPSDVPSAVSGTGADSETCSANCRASNYLYSYFTAGTATCQCSNDYPSPQLLQAVDGDMNCLATQARAARVYTTWYFHYCASYIQPYDGTVTRPTTGSTNTNPIPTIQPNQRACNAQCDNELPYYEGGVAAYKINTQECFCETHMTINTRPCTNDMYYVYLTFGHASTSALARREERVHIAREKRSVPKLCPSHLTPCKVGDKGGYECLDTFSELESCGGCASGLYAPEVTWNVTQPAGVDCTMLPGVRAGAVTCSNGECVATSCRIGYELFGSKCVPALKL